MEFWVFRILSFQFLGLWVLETLRFWDFGIRSFWVFLDFGMLSFWAFGIMGFSDFRILRFAVFGFLGF